jgi:hypothetical protein
MIASELTAPEVGLEFPPKDRPSVIIPFAFRIMVGMD